MLYQELNREIFSYFLFGYPYVWLISICYLLFAIISNSFEPTPLAALEHQVLWWRQALLGQKGVFGP